MSADGSGPVPDGLDSYLRLRALCRGSLVHADGSIVLWKMVSTEPSRKGFGGEDDDMNKETWTAVKTLRSATMTTVLAAAAARPLTGSRGQTTARPVSPVARTGPDAEIYDVSWSPTSTMLLSASIDHTARVWDVVKGRCAPGPDSSGQPGTGADV